MAKHFTATIGSSSQRQADVGHDARYGQGRNEPAGTGASYSADKLGAGWNASLQLSNPTMSLSYTRPN